MPQNGSMTRSRPGEPGHGGTAASLRLRPVRIADGVAQGGWTSQWEVICPACGDDDTIDYRGVSPFLQRIRGPYPTEQAGIAALRSHRGLATESPAAATTLTATTQTAIPQTAATTQTAATSRAAGIGPAWATPSGRAGS